MKRFAKFMIPLLLGALIAASCVWYLFRYDRDFTRDTLLSQARYQDMYGNSRLSAWFYDAAYNFSGHDENVAIELANQYKQSGNYTKAEVTLTKAIRNNPTPELYTALCKTYVEQDKLLDAVQLMENLPEGGIRTALYAQRPAAPTADQNTGYHSQYIDVKLESRGSKYLFYSLDGTYPSIAGAHYTGKISLPAGETTLCAIAVGEDGLVSPVSTLSYTITGVIEEVTFTDPAMEKALRNLIGADEDDTVYTDQLWAVTEFTAPEGVKTYADLSLLPRLTSLTLQDVTVDTLEHLRSLEKLVVLDLSGSRFPVEDLEFLSTLPSLSTLNLSRCGLSTLEGLENAKNLTCLILANNTVRNLTPLSQLTSLSELDLQHNAVTDLSALSGLEHLSKLNVSYNALKTLSPIGSCVRLKHLEAENNQIANLSGVDKLTALETLALDYNALTNVVALAGNTALKNLSIASNEIEDITCLYTLTKLEVFDFSGNLQIGSLPAWPEGMPLKTIDGSYNALVSIDALKTMQSLTHVYMDYNQITNIDALSDCFCLVQVNVFGNTIADVSALRDKDIIVNYDPTLAAAAAAEAEEE